MPKISAHFFGKGLSFGKYKAFLKLSENGDDVTIEEIKDMVGVDSLGYLDLEDLKKIATLGGKNGFCYACFDGKYPTELYSIRKDEE